MKFVFISTMKGYSWGGSEELWFETALHAKSEGNKVEVVVFENLPTSPKLAKLSKAGITVHYINELQMPNPTLLKRGVSKLLNRNSNAEELNRFDFINQTINPDFILLSQGGTTDVTHYKDLKIFFQSTRIPFCVVNHFHSEHGGIEAEQRKFLKVFFAKAKKNFFVSTRNKETIERLLACKIQNSFLARNPVNISSTEILEWKHSPMPSFAVVGRLYFANKGQDVLLQCLSQKKWLDRNFTVNVYGSGEDKTFFTDLVSYYKLEKKIFVKGHVSNVRSIWQENDVLILPSLAEGLPLTIVEAMICGRPCLVTDVGDSAFLISDNLDGWVADCASVKSLDEALERAWNNKSNWQEMGKQAHKKAVDFLVEDPGKTFFEQIIQ